MKPGRWIRRDTAKIAPASRSEDHDANLPILDVLVISHDAELQSLASSAVSDLGHRCTERRPGWTTALTSRMHTYHLVLADLRASSNKHENVFRGLSRFAANGRPSLMLIVDTPPEDPAAMLGLGIDDLIVSPVDPQFFKIQIELAIRRVHGRLGEESSSAETLTSYEHLLRAEEGADRGSWDWDLVADTVYFSRHWKSMLGFGEDEIGTDPEEWLGRLHPDDEENTRQAIQTIRTGEAVEFEHRYRMRHRDGSLRWLSARGKAMFRDGSATRFFGEHTDVTEAHERQLRLEHDALHDPLTDLPNRTVLIDRLQQAISRVGRRQDRTFAVLFFDLDRFKNVNDSLGHLAGDKLLAAIAHRVRATCRPADTVARFGGDEFVIIVEDITDVRSATAVAERVQEALRLPFDLEGIEVFTSISIGIVVWNPVYENAEQVLRDADTAMYRAKNLGKNCYAVFDEQMHATVVATLKLENDLRRAVARNEFRVFYQPILTLDDGRIVGFEALVRWQHPEKGLVEPAGFIRVAEEMGLIIQIDRWVAEESCRQLRAWNMQFRINPPLTMNVNISTTQFRQPDIVPTIDHILRKTGLYGQSLKLEVTESALLEDIRYASAMLEQLRALNIGICIDDFGTGYSSLSYLRRFEIDTLKIDRSFVAQMLVDEENAEIVRTISTLAGNLGKETVAEGVETASQLEELIALGVNRIQGTYVSPAIPPFAIQRLLTLTADSNNHLETILHERLSRGSGPIARPPV